MSLYDRVFLTEASMRQLMRRGDIEYDPRGSGYRGVTPRGKEETRSRRERGRARRGEMGAEAARGQRAVGGKHASYIDRPNEEPNEPGRETGAGRKRALKHLKTQFRDTPEKEGYGYTGFWGQGAPKSVHHPHPVIPWAKKAEREFQAARRESPGEGFTRDRHTKDKMIDVHRAATPQGDRARYMKWIESPAMRKDERFPFGTAAHVPELLKQVKQRRMARAFRGWD